MIKDVTLGQFLPGGSILHRLDPRTKILCTVAYLVLLFVVNNFYSLLAAFALLIFFISISGVPVKLILKSLKPIIFIVIFTAALNLFYSSSGEILFEIWKIKIYRDNVELAAFLVVRLICLVAGSSLLTYTTSPTSMTDAIEKLLKFLGFFRISSHDLAMMMTIALRFVPTLIEETDKIMSAQKARGSDMDSGGIIKKIKSFVPVFIPLFVSSIRRAKDLATAMECRCYKGGDGRTKLHTPHMGVIDMCAFLFMLIMYAGMIFLNIYFGNVI